MIIILILLKTYHSRPRSKIYTLNHRRCLQRMKISNYKDLTIGIS